MPWNITIYGTEVIQFIWALQDHNGLYINLIFQLLIHSFESYGSSSAYLNDAVIMDPFMVIT